MGSKIKDPFQQGYAEGVEEGIATQPRKTAIKILDALMETSNTMRRRGKMVDGYKKGISDAKDATQAQDKKKVKKASGGVVKGYAPGGAIKKVKPLMGEILNATDKRRRKEFMAKSKKPINLKKKKLKTIKAASGGLLKAAPNEGVTKLPKDVRNKMGFLKKGGAVKKMKKCRMDGIALRGKTRAKQRSK